MQWKGQEVSGLLIELSCILIPRIALSWVYIKIWLYSHFINQERNIQISICVNKLVSELMTNAMSQMSLSRLTKSDYKNWSIQMKVLLGSLDAWEVIKDGFEEPTYTTTYTATQNKTLKETRSKDKTTLYMLFRVFDESDFEKIVGSSTSREA